MMDSPTSTRASTILTRLFAFSATAFALRAVVGFFVEYGSPMLAAMAFGFAVFFAALCVVLHSRESKESEQGLAAYPALSGAALIVPFTAYSLIALADSLTIGGAAASPWALLVLLPSIFDFIGTRPISYAAPLFASILPGICGIIDASGGFSGRPPHPGAFITLGIAIIAAAFARALGRERQSMYFRAAANQMEREHALSAKRDSEVEIAARIQRALLLDPPDEDCRDLTLEAITVASNAVDGDFYGFIPYSKSSIDVLVGDVMGKGVPAALLGAALKGSFLRSSVELLVSKPGTVPKPEDLVSAVHESVVAELMNLESFATLQYARINVDQSRMDFVDCGHTPILHYDANLGQCWSIKGSDFPLGFTEERNYSRFSLPLAPGDRLLFYSDGITEAPSESGELFGEKRLSDIVTANAALEPRELVRRILNTTMFFSSEEGFKDDVTCIAVSVAPFAPDPARASQDFPMDSSSMPSFKAFLEQVLATEEPSLSGKILSVAEREISAIIRYGAKVDPATEPKETPVDLIEELPGDEEKARPSGLPEDGSFHAELLRVSSWIALRVVYRGETFPWHHVEKPPSPPKNLSPGESDGSEINADADSILCASSGGGYRLLCLFFDR